jgi:hypothetical protein
VEGSCLVLLQVQSWSLSPGAESFSESNLLHGRIRPGHLRNTRMAVHSCHLIWTKRATSNVWHNLDTNAVTTERDCETQSRPVQYNIRHCVTFFVCGLNIPFKAC